MNHYTNIRIKKRSLTEILSLYIFILPFCLSFLMDFIGINSVIKYSIDVVWVGLFALLVFRKQSLIEKKIFSFVVFIISWLLYVFIVYLFKYQSVFYFLWGLRNNFRFYAAFILFATFFDETTADDCFKLMDILFFINAVVSFVQFFALGYKQDYLGGIFGVGRGCNAYSIVFFSIIVARSILLFLSAKEYAIICFLKCAISLVLSAMAELKFFFVIFIFILAIAMFITKVFWKKVIALSVIAILLMFSSSILTEIFGKTEKLTLQRIFELITAQNYSSAEDLGRFTAIPTISNTVLKTPLERIFGMGLGNCDTSTFAICNSTFYQLHESLHYTWFSSAFIFLETGYVGLIINLLFFSFSFFLACKQYKRDGANQLYCQLTIIMSILCVVLTFYNSVLRTEIAYVVFFVLALPLMQNKKTTIEKFNL